jgi:peptidyl-prolyl cis-trans isomerase A (cyclophilin A)
MLQVPVSLRRCSLLALGCFAAAPIPSLAQVGAAGEKLIPIVIETELGPIEAVLDSARAPVTVTNFLRYADAGLFEGARFFRSVRLDNQPDDSVKIEVIQAELSPESSGKAFPPIPLERTSVTGLHHGDGALSMARAGPDTGASSFFITINDQPELDFGGKRNPDGQGFAVFGRVTQGMDLVRSIQARPVTGQRLDTPVRILRVVRR